MLKKKSSGRKKKSPTQKKTTELQSKKGAGKSLKKTPSLPLSKQAISTSKNKIEKPKSSVSSKSTSAQNALRIKKLEAALKAAKQELQALSKSIESKKNENSNNRYNTILMQSQFAFSIMKGKDMVVTVANDLMKEFWGKGNQVEGKTLLEVLPELKGQPFPDMIDSVYTTGKPVYANEILARLNHNGIVEDRYFNIIYQPHLEADETISGVITIAHEVTNQVLLRKKIEESEHRYHTLVYTSPSLIAIFKGEDMIIEIANDAVLESWGKGKDIIGKSVFEAIPETVEQGFDKLLLSVYKTGEPAYAYETPITLVRNGKSQLMHYTFVYQTQRDINGEIEGVAVLANEVTPQVLAKNKLKESEKKYKDLILGLPVGIYTCNAEGIIELYNDIAVQLWGRRPEPGKEKWCGSWKMFNPDGTLLPHDECPMAIAVKEGQFISREIIVERPDGTRSTVMPHPKPIYDLDGKITGVVNTIIDITEQVIARRQIEESEQQLQNLFRQAPAAIGVLDGAHHKYVLANAAYQKMTNRSEEQLVGKTVKEVFPELQSSGAFEIFDTVFKTAERFVAPEFPVQINKFNDGVMHNAFYNFTIEPVKNAADEVVSLMIVAYDITESIEAKKKIEASEAFSRSVLNSSPDCIKILDDEGRLQFMNENGMCAMEIDDFNKFKNNYWWDLWEEKNQPIIKDAVTKALNGERVQFQSMSNTAKGTSKWWDVIVTPILIDGATEKSKRIISVSRDITDFKDATLKVEESEKRYNNLITSSPSAIGILQGENLIITTANNAIIEIWGKGKDIIGKAYFEALPELVDQGYKEIFDEVYKTGKPFIAVETPVTFLQNGKMTLKYYNFLVQAQQNVYGDIEGLGIIATEVTSQALANKKIKASEEQFRLLVEQAPVAICVLRGENYVIEIINERMSEMWDRTMEQALNKPAFDVLPELKEQGFKELLDTVYNTGKRFVAEELPISLKRKGKLQSAYVKFIYEPLREADGTVSGVMALAHEITEQVVSRKKIEENETKFRTLIEDAPVATCLFTGREMKIEVANDIMIGYWGKDKNVIGKTLIDAVPELKGQPFLKILDEVFTTGKIYESKNAYAQLELNGVLGEYYFDYTYKPIHNANGEVYGIMDMAVDVTEQVLAMKKLEASEQKLEKAVISRTSELQETNLALNEKYIELESMNKELEAFTFVSSHDLQEPLRKIRNFISLLEAEETQLSEDGKDYLKGTRETANRMQVLIEDLLTYSRLKKADLVFEKTNLNEIVEETIADFADIIEEKKAIVKADGLCEVSIIRFQFRQLLHNLISNALKFSHPERAPLITIKSETVKGSELNDNSDLIAGKLLPNKNYCHIIFTDNGIGFDQQYNDRIFEVFQRLHEMHEYKGTGIGLAICKRIVENHNGFITATGELNKGARFDIYLPRHD